MFSFLVKSYIKIRNYVRLSLTPSSNLVILRNNDLKLNPLESLTKRDYNL